MANPFDGPYYVVRAGMETEKADEEWIPISIAAGSSLLITPRHDADAHVRVLTGIPADGPRWFDRDDVGHRWPVVIVPGEPPAVYQDFGDRRCYIGMPAPGSEPAEAVVDLRAAIAAVGAEEWSARQRAAVDLRRAADLGASEKERAVEALLKLLWDREPAVRMTALAALASFEDVPKASEGIKWAERRFQRRFGSGST
jgi:hypothetical protein